MGYLANLARRFFHPAAIDEMLSTFVPLINGTSLDVCIFHTTLFRCLKPTEQLQSILSSQYYLLTFLPLSHPQSYLPMLFRMWESINSYMYDDRMMYFLSRLAEMHVDPTVSDPRKISGTPDDAKTEGEGRPNWPREDLNLNEDNPWHGLYKDVGIFTEHEWDIFMCKCLASMRELLFPSADMLTLH